MKYRSYSPDDLDSIVTLEKRAFEVGPYTKGMLLRLFRMKESFILIAENEGRIVAYVIAIPLGDGAADIESLAVDPDYQRSGIGSALMEKIEEMMLDRGIYMSILEVRDRNDQAIRFYKRIGYEIITHMSAYYHELYRESRGAYRMGKILRPGTETP